MRCLLGYHGRAVIRILGSSRRHGILFGGFVALYLLLFTIASFEQLSSRKVPTSDAGEYVNLGYNLAKNGAFSLAGAPRNEGRYAPSVNRPPGYPAFLAFGMWLSGDPLTLEHEALFTPEAIPRLRPVRMVQCLLLLATSALAFLIVRKLTGNLILAGICMVLVGLDSSLQSMNRVFLSEQLGTFLFTLLTLFIVEISRGGRLVHFAAAGLSLAFLALTRAAFYHFWAPLLALYLGWQWRKAFDWKRILRTSGVFLLCFFVPAWAWMARNLHHFDRFIITEGGGLVLKIRAGMNMMTAREYLASFLYWSESEYLAGELLPAAFGPGAATRVAGFDPESFFWQAVNRRKELRRVEVRTAAADKILFREARAEILRHPVRHLLATIPLSFRGMKVERDLGKSMFLWLGLAAALGLAWRQGRAQEMAALCPAAISFGLHALLTHNIPRYNMILIPVLWISLVLILSRIAGSLPRQ